VKRRGQRAAWISGSVSVALSAFLFVGFGLAPLAAASGTRSDRVIVANGVRLVVPSGWQRVPPASPGPRHRPAHRPRRRHRRYQSALPALFEVSDRRLPPPAGGRRRRHRPLAVDGQRRRRPVDAWPGAAGEAAIRAPAELRVLLRARGGRRPPPRRPPVSGQRPGRRPRLDRARGRGACGRPLLRSRALNRRERPCPALGRTRPWRPETVSRPPRSAGSARRACSPAGAQTGRAPAHA